MTLQQESSYGKNNLSNANNKSNEHIKKFKKSKGAEYVQTVKKRKFVGDGGSESQTNTKKSRPSEPYKKGKFNKFDAKQSTHHGNKPEEKPDWNKMRQETKERKKKRKQRNVGGEELYNSLSKAIKLWEELRHSNCSKERRLELCREVAKLFAGNVKVWIKQASGIRMAEHLVTYGDADVRRVLFDEVNSKELILDIMKDTHSQHFLQKILRHGNKEQRQAIITATEGRVVKLTKHAIASQVIELAYAEYATAAQRATMMQEFFGPHFRYFKEEGIKNLKDVLNKYPNKKEAIMNDLQSGLQAIMHKGIFNNSLILSLLKEYMMYCEHAERQTVIESVEDGLLPVLHLRDGARIAMLCLWHGTAKQRKSILKSFKEHLLEVATWNHSYLVLLAAMDCVDDTKFLSKAVLDPLMKEKEKLLESENGTRVFRYMVLGRNPTYFHPDVLSVLRQGDGNPNSKKDPAVRREEILAHISSALLESILSNVEFWSRNSQWTLFLGPAVQALRSKQHRQSALESLARHCGEVMPEDVKTLMDVSHSAKMLNFVIAQDVENKKNKMPLFSLLLIKHASENIVKWLSCNRGCFLCVRLLETGIGRVVVAVRSLLTPHLKKVESIRGTAVGADILLKKLKETEEICESEVEDEEEDATAQAVANNKSSPTRMEDQSEQIEGEEKESMMEAEDDESDNDDKSDNNDEGESDDASDNGDESDNKDESDNDAEGDDNEKENDNDAESDDNEDENDNDAESDDNENENDDNEDENDNDAESDDNEDETVENEDDSEED